MNLDNDRNVANNQFTGWIPNELKNIGNLEYVSSLILYFNTIKTY